MTDRLGVIQEVEEHWKSHTKYVNEVLEVMYAGPESMKAAGEAMYHALRADGLLHKVYLHDKIEAFAKNIGYKNIAEMVTAVPEKRGLLAKIFA